MPAPVRYNGSRYRRPPPTARPIFTKPYAWKTVTIKVWWPTTGKPPGWDARVPGT